MRNGEAGWIVEPVAVTFAACFHPLRDGVLEARNPRAIHLLDDEPKGVAHEPVPMRIKRIEPELPIHDRARRRLEIDALELFVEFIRVYSQEGRDRWSSGGEERRHD